MRILLSICIVLTFFATSCKTQKQATAYNYLQNTADTTFNDSLVFKQPVIQKGDILSIRVYSSAHGVDARADAPYNLPTEIGAAGSAAGGSGGVLVDEEGNIEYPQIGLLHAEGLTRELLAAELKKRLEGQLNQPSVIVRFQNYRITVLGEVSNPGSFSAPTDRINIFEAIGMAGDITEFGLRNTVKIYRDNNGERQIATLDLTSKDIFNSPFYRLKQNDIVFVEQSKRKVKQQQRQEIGQQISIATSIMTAIALILNLIK